MTMARRGPRIGVTYCTTNAWNTRAHFAAGEPLSVSRERSNWIIIEERAGACAVCYAFLDARRLALASSPPKETLAIITVCETIDENLGISSYAVCVCVCVESLVPNLTSR